MNYPALKDRVSLRASSFGGFHPRCKQRGILAAEIKEKAKINKKDVYREPIE